MPQMSHDQRAEDVTSAPGQMCMCEINSNIEVTTSSPDGGGGRSVMSMSACLTARITRTSPNFCADGVAMRFVLPVSRMTTSLT